MKKRIMFSILIVFALALLLIIPSSFAVEAGLTGDDIITIDDEVLKNTLVNRTLDPIDLNGDGQISVNEMKNITYLGFSNDLPTDLSPLMYATSLYSISISGDVKSIAPLENLPNKENITSMFIQLFQGSTRTDIDLTGLSEFQSLNRLHINGHNINQIGEIVSLVNLTELNLGQNNITNLTELTKLTNLTNLTLNDNQITDISVLRECTKLESLNLSNNQIIDISSLNGCINLKELYLTNNKVTVIPELSGLTNLEKIQVTNNPLTDASGLNSLKALKTIYLSGTDLTNIELRDLTNLETFNINIANSTEKTITLENLTNLKDIQMANAKVTEVNIINCPNVENVNAAGNKIQDISFLKDLLKLKTVELTSNPFAQDSEKNAQILADLETRGVTVQKDPYYDSVGPKYELNANGTGYIVTDFFGMNETEVVIPATYEGLPVVEIGDEAFYRVYSDYNLEKIVLPETITKIGDRAFAECQKLTSINIPKGVTEIGRGAFEECKLLENITLPNITVISYGLFWGCSSLNNVIIPETVTDIRGMAFYDCTSLTEIVVPDSVIYLGDNTGSTEGYSEGVFSGCTNLRKITLSKNIKKMGHNTFAGCSSLEALVIPEGVVEIDACALNACVAMKKLVLPRTFTVLEETLRKSDFNPVIYGYKGTKAEELATEQGFEFVALDGNFVKADSEEKLDSVEVEGENVTILPVEKETGLEYINTENFPALNNNYEVKVLDKDGNEKDDTSKIGSRSVIKITDELGNIFAEITVVVPGDVTGNGYARMYDAFQILKDTIIPGVTLDAIDEKIRDYNDDGNVRMYDAFQFLKDSILG